MSTAPEARFNSIIINNTVTKKVRLNPIVELSLEDYMNEIELNTNLTANLNTNLTTILDYSLHVVISNKSNISVEFKHNINQISVINCSNVTINLNHNTVNKFIVTDSINTNILDGFYEIIELTDSNLIIGALRINI